MAISGLSSGSWPLSLPSTSVTSATLRGLRASVPLKITSCMCSARRLRLDCSPMTHLMLSTMLLLPQPLGPRIAEMPSWKSMRVRSAKLLKPKSSMLLRNK